MDAGGAALMEAGSGAGDACCSGPRPEEHPAAITTSATDPAISRPAPNDEHIITEHDWSSIEEVPWPQPVPAGNGRGTRSVVGLSIVGR